jgi:peroxin-4
LDLLKTAWSPAWTLKSTVLAISLLLSNPEPSSPLNCDAANLLRCGDIVGYESMIRMYTQLFAMKEETESQ